MEGGSEMVNCGRRNEYKIRLEAYCVTQRERWRQREETTSNVQELLEETKLLFFLLYECRRHGERVRDGRLKDQKLTA